MRRCRYVWRIIEQFKSGRAIVLTTHSMEEADILGDRIAIIARGRMRCIGTSTHLKQTHGKGYRISVGVAVNPSDLDTKNRYWGPIAEVLYRYHALFEKESGSLMTYWDFNVTREHEGTLPALFAELDRRKAELGIIDINLGMVTLEDVFLAIAKQAEVRACWCACAAHGRRHGCIVADCRGQGHRHGAADAGQ